MSDENITRQDGYSHLLSPLTIGATTIKNRAALTAHGDRYADNGLVSERLIEHYEERARGGAGLIVALGSAPVHAGFSGASNSNPALVGLWNRDNDAPLLRMSERVHQHGAVLLAQATHRGQRERPSGTSPYVVAPSTFPGAPPEGAPAVLREDQIADLIEAYAVAAARLEQAGFDGIQVTATPSHLIENFWSPLLNRRTDQYGGSLANRLRFGLEVLQAVHNAVSRDFLISFRMSGSLLTDDLGLTSDDLLGIASEIDKNSRVDIFDITAGSGLDTATHSGAVPTDDFPIEMNNEFAGKVRKQVTAQVLVAGRILDADSAERSLQRGDCDLVAMTRAMIADPSLMQKVYDDDTERIRPCIAINEGCRRVIAGQPMSCTVNPEAGNALFREPYAPASAARHVLVVGAGPAGMEAARVASERGHRVTLVEKESTTGGQMTVACLAPSRPHLGGHIAWLERELSRLEIDLQKTQEATPDLIAEVDPDLLVLSTGSYSYLPTETNDFGARVVTDTDALLEKITIGADSRVVVYDAEGYHRGCDVATWASDRGASVELISPFVAPAHHLEGPNKRAMYRQLDRSRVEVVNNHRLHSSFAGGLMTREVWTDALRRTEDMDTCIVVGFHESSIGLYTQVRESFPSLETRLVGDALAPRLLRNAIYEGVRAGIEA